MQLTTNMIAILIYLHIICSACLFSLSLCPRTRPPPHLSAPSSPYLTKMSLGLAARGDPTPTQIWARQQPSVVTKTVFSGPSQTQASSGQSKSTAVPVLPIVVGVLSGVLLVCAVVGGWIWWGRKLKAEQRAIVSLYMTSYGQPFDSLSPTASG